MSLIVEKPIPFVFVHLPRTGGRSVSEALISAIEDINIKKFPPPPEAEALLGRSVKAHPYYRILHAGLNRLKLLNSKKNIKNYYKFSVVRNPWDIAISYYFYSFPHQDFDEKLFIEFVIPHLKRIDYLDKLSLNKRFALDYVLRFENLATDFKTLCKNIEISPPLLPCIGKGKRKKGYRSYYNSATRKLIKKVFQKYNQIFNYEF